MSAFEYLECRQAPKGQTIHREAEAGTFECRYHARAGHTEVVQVEAYSFEQATEELAKLGIAECSHCGKWSEAAAIETTPEGYTYHYCPICTLDDPARYAEADPPMAWPDPALLEITERMLARDRRLDAILIG